MFPTLSEGKGAHASSSMACRGNMGKEATQEAANTKKAFMICEYYVATFLM
jgi:hypothetical protein